VQAFCYGSPQPLITLVGGSSTFCRRPFLTVSPVPDNGGLVGFGGRYRRLQTVMPTRQIVSGRGDVLPKVAWALMPMIGARPPRECLRSGRVHGYVPPMDGSSHHDPLSDRAARFFTSPPVGAYGAPDSRPRPAARIGLFSRRLICSRAIDPHPTAVSTFDWQVRAPAAVIPTEKGQGRPTQPSLEVEMRNNTFCPFWRW